MNNLSNPHQFHERWRSFVKRWLSSVLSVGLVRDTKLKEILNNQKTFTDPQYVTSYIG